MRVILAMPRYDSRAHIAAAQSFYHSSSQDYPGVEVRAISPAGSLLTGCFNSCWAVARNEWEASNADGFAMQHSDVAPQIYWLDALHAELERSGADIIGVTMPIKDNRWMHSTAQETGDHWRVKRLSSVEIMRLPETFTEKEVPGLLLNTGLWLCRLGPWCLETLFHVEDVIQRGPGGRWRAGSMPEDWNFSRQCRKLGLKLACTRKVVAEHYGEHKWNNQHIGGWYTDLQNADALTEWIFPQEVDGWLSDDEGRELALSAMDRDVLEIGSYCGKSTICMAQTAASVTAVDTFDGRATPKPADTLPTFLENVKRYGVSDRVKAIKGTSAQEVPGMGRRFGLAFIDGAHDRDSVLADAEVATSVLVPGGLLAFHDYRIFPGEHDGFWNPGVTEAVNEILAGGAQLMRRSGTVAVVQPCQ